MATLRRPHLKRTTVVCLLFVSFGAVALAVGEVHNRSLVHQVDADGRPHHVLLRRGIYEIYTDPGSELATVGPGPFTVHDGGRPVRLEPTSLQAQLGDVGSLGSGIGLSSPNAKFEASATGRYDIIVAVGGLPSPGLTIIVAPTGDHLMLWLLPGAVLILIGALIFFVMIVLEKQAGQPQVWSDQRSVVGRTSSSSVSQGRTPGPSAQT